MKTKYYFDGEMSQCEKDPSRALSWFQIYTRVKVGPTTCAAMFDRSSEINLVSQTLVDALKLVVIEHPDPYKLRWQGKFVTIKHQVEVTFGFCGFTNSVFCDVLPYHMYMCSLILGKSWTKKRELQIDKSGYFSWRKFQIFRNGRWIYFEAYSSEQYLEDRKRRDRAHAAINAKKEVEQILLEKKKAEDSLVGTKNISSHEKNKEKPAVPTSGLNMQLKRVHDEDDLTVDKGQRMSLFQTQCDIKGVACKLIIDGGSCTNGISKMLVEKLGLSAWRYGEPYHLEWLNNCGKLKLHIKYVYHFQLSNILMRWNAMFYRWKLVVYYLDDHGSTIVMPCILAGPILIHFSFREANDT